MALIRRILATHEDGHRVEWGEVLFDCRIRRHGLPIGEIMAAYKCRHAVPGSGTSRMSRAVAETRIGRIGNAPEAAGGS